METKFYVFGYEFYVFGYEILDFGNQNLDFSFCCSGEIMYFEVVTKIPEIQNFATTSKMQNFDTTQKIQNVATTIKNSKFCAQKLKNRS